MTSLRFVGRRRWLGILALAATSIGCAADAAPVSRHAERAGGIPVAECLAALTRGVQPDPARCPGFLVESLQAALEICRDAGGTLAPEPETRVWALDVNGDGMRELTFATEGNVGCREAWSVFSCGSLGCPDVLYQERDGAWRAIAAFHAVAPEAIEVVAAAAGGEYGDLRIGCAGPEPCTEYWYQVWDGERYAGSHVEVRGFRVDFAGPDGLRGLTGETAVLATPEADGAVLARYAADTEVAIIGTAVGSDYYYVSPCNACESGFVPRSAVRPD